MYDSIKERFLSKMEAVPFSGCWIWTASISDGYGTFRFYGSVEKAHRVAWMLFRGPIPSELLVCHRCDIKCCVNPEHLYLGTSTDNVYDAINRGSFSGGIHLLRDGKYFCLSGKHELTSRGRCKECHREGNRLWYRRKVDLSMR